MNQPQKRIAIYLRSATGDHSHLRKQLHSIEKEFSRRSLDFKSVSFYVDPQFSGRSAGPELQRLYDDARLGKVSAIVIERYNRISLTLKGLLQFLEFIRRHDVQFISCNENADSSLWPKQEGSLS